jgi:hypothetical protein
MAMRPFRKREMSGSSPLAGSKMDGCVSGLNGRSAKSLGVTASKVRILRHPPRLESFAARAAIGFETRDDTAYAVGVRLVNSPPNRGLVLLEPRVNTVASTDSDY